MGPNCSRRQIHKVAYNLERGQRASGNGPMSCSWHFGNEFRVFPSRENAGELVHDPACLLAY